MRQVMKSPRLAVEIPFARLIHELQRVFQTVALVVLARRDGAPDAIFAFGREQHVVIVVSAPRFEVQAHNSPVIFDQKLDLLLALPFFFRLSGPLRRIDLLPTLSSHCLNSFQPASGSRDGVARRPLT
jgi:hypothetical protein